VIPRFVELTPYNPQWPALFQAERASILDACRGLVKSAHHIGSTAVPGMSAKPIIDMLALLGQDRDGLACIEHMGRLGYEYRGDSGIEGRHYFRRGTPRAYHVHMYAADHPEVRRHLMFRNYLRSHPDEALAYEALKRDLATRSEIDPPAYTRAKKGFCDRIDILARSASRDAPDPK
jgi:GrpB-like predicted nucleotidyltransferase (UPF0157 family)